MESISPFCKVTGKILGMKQPECRRAMELFIQRIPLSESQLRDIEGTLSLRDDDLYKVVQCWRRCKSAVLEKARHFQRQGDPLMAARLFLEIHEYEIAADLYKERNTQMYYYSLIMASNSKICEYRTELKIGSILGLLVHDQIDSALDMMIPDK